VPLVIFAALILRMYHILANKPGGQPIGALERFFAKSTKFARSMLPSRRRVEAEA
jgi:lipopolysaccharide export system permease protein